MDNSNFLKSFGSLFEVFGWWTIVLIAVVVVVMVGVNLGWKHLFKSSSLARIKKIVAYMSTYVVSFAVLFLFTKLFTKTEITISYLFGSALSLGVCSQAVWEVIKVIRDYGGKAFVAWLCNSSSLDKFLKELSTKYNIDLKLVKSVVNEAETQLKDVDTSEVEKVLKEDTEFTNSLKEKLETVIASDSISNALTDFISAIQKKASI